MVDATLGTILQTEGQRQQWQIARGLGRRPETQIRNTQNQQLLQLLKGSKRDGCVVQYLVDVLGVADKAIAQARASF